MVAFRLIRLAAALGAACLIAPALHAADAELASASLDLSASVTSDLRTRGISDSFNRPGARLGLQWAHESGVVALAELASVSRRQFLDGAGVGVTLAGGYRWGDPERWHFGLGAATEFFPGAGFDAPHALDEAFQPTDVRRTRYDSRFAVLEAGWGVLETRLLSVLSRSYRGADTGGVCGTLLALRSDPTDGANCYARGDHGSRGTWLFDVDTHLPLGAATTLNLHAGHQHVANFREADFTDWRVGLTHKRWGFEWALDWVDTHTRARELYLAVDGERLRATDGSRLVLTVTRHF